MLVLRKNFTYVLNERSHTSKGTETRKANLQMPEAHSEPIQTFKMELFMKLTT